MNFLKRLTNPLLLVAEGFLVGALAFALVNPQWLGASHDPSPQSDAIMRNLTR